MDGKTRWPRIRRLGDWFQAHPFWQVAWGAGLTILADAVWIGLDGSVPAWDQGDHLSRALEFWRVWQLPDWGSGAWWQDLWGQAPSYRGPLLPLVTVAVWHILGCGLDQALLANSVFTLVLVFSLYHLGRILGGSGLGVWAAGLGLAAPILVLMRTDYLLDYGLTAWITLTLATWMSWRRSVLRSPQSWHRGWGWSLAAGLALALVVLTRPTGILFLGLPCLGLGMELLWRRRWLVVPQALLALTVALLLCRGWIQTNWLTILTSINQARNWGIRYQADDIPGWWFYLQSLPQMVGWTVLVVGIVGWGIRLGLPTFADPSAALSRQHRDPLVWWHLGIFVAGTYLICATAPSRDVRFGLPALPIGLVLLAVGILAWPLPLGTWLRRGLALVCVGMVGVTLFAGSHRPYRGPTWPHPQVIDTVIEAAPHVVSNVAVLPLTAGVNPFNFNAYGLLQEFRVVARQPTLAVEFTSPESRSWDWFVTQTGDQGEIQGLEAGLTALQRAILSSSELQDLRQWELPDGHQLHLWRRRVLTLEADPLPDGLPEIQMQAVQVPAQVPPGQVVPVTYTWTGSSDPLRQSIAVLTWQAADGSGWAHDHGIALGRLLDEPPHPLQVTEHLAMRAGSRAGVYRLKGVLLNRLTQEVTELRIPPVQVEVKAETSPPAAPELDVITQFEGLNGSFAQGHLDPVFRVIGRLNQLDPRQDYLNQLQAALQYRLQQDPNRLEWLYSQALAQVLQRRIPEAEATLTRLTTLDATNPYPWMYQAVVQLYQFHPQAALMALQQAEQRDPTLPELPTLNAVAAIQSGRWIRAWQLLMSP